MLDIINWSTLPPAEQHAILARPVLVPVQTMLEKVQGIIERVKLEGDVALHALTQQFDQVSLAQLAVSTQELTDAKRNISEQALAAINFAQQQLTTYHTAQLPQPYSVETTPGIQCERQARPIPRVGLYIPGGSAPLVSTVLMLAVPAGLANCPLRVLCTPPNRDGNVDPHILVAAQLCGITHIFKIGGAQAIAAMAYGTQSIPKVDKIYGPGNSWVTQAKMRVSQDPQGATIDMPAGPSEVMVIADQTADPTYVAADLLSQAEHGPDSQVILVALSEAFAITVREAVMQQLNQLPRRSIATQSLQHSRFLVTTTIEQALDISNRYAPEHLILQVASPHTYIPLVQNAGAVFLGHWTPETMGDYVTGSNHVLPTSGYARSVSGLAVSDFMKYISFQTVTSAGLKSAGPFAQQLATLEGLQAHNNAIALRLQTLNES